MAAASSTMARARMGRLARRTTRPRDTKDHRRPAEPHRTPARWRVLAVRSAAASQWPSPSSVLASACSVKARRRGIADGVRDGQPFPRVVRRRPQVAAVHREVGPRQRSTRPLATVGSGPASASARPSRARPSPMCPRRDQYHPQAAARRRQSSAVSARQSRSSATRRLSWSAARRSSQATGLPPSAAARLARRRRGNRRRGHPVRRRSPRLPRAVRGHIPGPSQVSGSEARRPVPPLDAGNMTSARAFRLRARARTNPAMPPLAIE